MRFNNKEQNIWFTSDTHYWHKNITYGESVWSNKEENCRKFNTTQEMSRHLVEQINKYVEQDDILFHLGDWSFGGINNIWNFRKQIICKNIHLIYGNHDQHIIKNATLPNCLTNVFVNIVDKEDGLLGVPTLGQNIFSSCNQYSEIFIDGRMLCLMHYPIQEWNDRHHNSWMLHGHQHGKNIIIPKRLDVGIDNAFKLFGEYKPFSWEEICKILRKDENNVYIRHTQ